MYSRLQLVEFDEAKAAANLLKHGVDFRDAADALVDPFGMVVEDHDAKGEPRYVTVAYDKEFRLLVVVHVTRGENARIVSARRASRGENRRYSIFRSGRRL